MSDYYYYTLNGKKTYGGKRSERLGDGYYGKNDAGDKRHFKGNESEKYTFSNTKLGPHTFTARSYEDALRQAKALGYSSKDYKAKKRGRK